MKSFKEFNEQLDGVISESIPTLNKSGEFRVIYGRGKERKLNVVYYSDGEDAKAFRNTLKKAGWTAILSQNGKVIREVTVSGLDEAIVDITIDPNMKIASTSVRQHHAMKLVRLAKANGLKAVALDNHVRIKGLNKTINDVLRASLGASSMGNPTEQDTTSPQIDKMLTKALKNSGK